MLAVAGCQPAPQIGYNTRRDRKPQPDTIAGLLGRVKRLEQAIEIFDPGAIIAHGKRRRLTR